MVCIEPSGNSGQSLQVSAYRASEENTNLAIEILFLACVQILTKALDERSDSRAIILTATVSNDKLLSGTHIIADINVAQLLPFSSRPPKISRKLSVKRKRVTGSFGRGSLVASFALGSVARSVLSCVEYGRGF